MDLFFQFIDKVNNLYSFLALIVTGLVYLNKKHSKTKQILKDRMSKMIKSLQNPIVFSDGTNGLQLSITPKAIVLFSYNTFARILVVMMISLAVLNCFMFSIEYNSKYLFTALTIIPLAMMTKKYMAFIIKHKTPDIFNAILWAIPTLVFLGLLKSIAS